MTVTYRFRSAQISDLHAIAALQTNSWQSTYRGHLPDAFLQTEVPDLLQARWQAWPGPEWRIETAWDDETLSGFASVDLGHTGGAYVDNLHVTASAKGQGIGRVLMGRAAQHAIPIGRLWLTVITENKEARAFYRRLGGQEAAPAQEWLYGVQVTAHPVVWTGAPLTDLAQCGA